MRLELSVMWAEPSVMWVGLSDETHVTWTWSHTVIFMTLGISQ